MKQVSELFSKVVLKEHFWKVKLLKRWKFIIGDFGDKIDIEKIDGDLLVLAAKHSVWANEIFLLSDFIKKKINKELGKDYIKNIRIVTKKKRDCYFVNKKKIIKNDDNHKNLEIFKHITDLTPKEIKALNKVSDCELQESLKDFYLSCKKE